MTYHRSGLRQAHQRRVRGSGPPRKSSSLRTPASPAPKAATSARASIGCSKPSRRDVDMVAAWSVDRLGRSLIDLLDFLRELHAKGFDLFLHQQGLDTSTPSGRAMFQMLGVFAEFERSMIRERVMAGLSRAKADGIQLGRRRLEDSDADKVAAIVAARTKGTGIRRIARELGVDVGTVLRVTGEARLGASALLAHGMAQARGIRLTPTARYVRDKFFGH